MSTTTTITNKKSIINDMIRKNNRDLIITIALDLWRKISAKKLDKYISSFINKNIFKYNICQITINNELHSFVINELTDLFRDYFPETYKFSYKLDKIDVNKDDINVQQINQITYTYTMVCDWSTYIQCGSLTSYV